MITVFQRDIDGHGLSLIGITVSHRQQRFLIFQEAGLAGVKRPVERF
jgi:hypothetical protein